MKGTGKIGNKEKSSYKLKLQSTFQRRLYRIQKHPEKNIEKKAEGEEMNNNNEHYIDVIKQEQCQHQKNKNLKL